MGRALPSRAGADRQAYTGALQAALEAATGDTEALLQIRCIEEDPGANITGNEGIFNLGKEAAAQLTEEPRRAIALPLTVRPKTRATSPVTLATIAFADPSYDRELSGPGAAQTARDQKGALWKIALDSSSTARTRRSTLPPA